MEENVDFFAKLISEIRLLKVKPEKLFHYTNSNGFYGIISSSSFWASDVAYMNDSREFILGKTIAMKVMKSLATTAGAEMRQFLERVIAAVSKELKSGDGFRIHVISFSPKSDSLSQWRGYAHDGQGYSIGVPSKVIESMKQDDFVDLGILPVIYKKELFENWVVEIMNGAFNEKEKGRLKDLYLRELSAVTALDFICALFKQEGFAEEGEWRYVIYRDKGDNLEKVSFRVKDEIIIPYISIPFSNRGQPLLICRGPKQKDYTNFSIENMSLKFNIPLIIKKSSVSYR